MPALPDDIEREIASLTDNAGLALIDISRRGQTNSSVIEVIVDSEEGATIDQIANLSRDISRLLDGNEGAIKGSYRLDVSTPGLDRPLELDWQIRKNVGRLVKVTWSDADQPDRTWTEHFRLAGFDNNRLDLALQKVGKKKKSKKKSAPSPIPEDGNLTLERSVIRKIVVEPEL